MKPFESVKNQNGITLLEMLVATGISGVVTLAISMVMVFAIEQFNLLVEQNSAEEQMLSAAYLLRLNMSQATSLSHVNNIERTASFLNPTAGHIQCGRNLRTIAGDPFYGNYALLADFRREVGAVDPVTLRVTGSEFTLTGIYGRPPWTPIGSTIPASGGLAFISNRNITLIDISQLVVAGSGASFVDRLHDIRLDCTCVTMVGVNCANNSPIISVSARITARYFKDVNRNQAGAFTWNYRNIPCITPGNPVGCVMNPAGQPRDFSMTATFGIRNNVLRASSLTGDVGRAELLHGPLYYFRFAAPPPTSL